MKITLHFLILSMFFTFLSCSEEGENNPPAPSIQLSKVEVGGLTLDLTNAANNVDVPFDQPIVAYFSMGIDLASTEAAIILREKNGSNVSIEITLSNINKIITVTPLSELSSNQKYELVISDDLRGDSGETFAGIIIGFSTVQKVLSVTSLKFDNTEKLTTTPVIDISWSPEIKITFSDPIDPTFSASPYIRVFKKNGTSIPVTYALSESNTVVTLNPITNLTHLTGYRVSLSAEITGVNEELFSAFNKDFYTVLDHTPKFPLISDDELLTLVQQQTFTYFYDFAHPASGMARERNTSGNTVTSGGSGFGIMALIVGMERNFITRQQGLDRMDKILDFLETADEFHGAWAHWMDGNTGNVIPFSANDNGGDLVETSFLVQGLITFRQYLNAGIPEESALIDRINFLWERVDWDWYRKGGQNVLYWHWSPDKGWIMNFALSGYFEQQITYFLAAASPTHSIPKVVYTNGFTQNGGFVRNDTYTYNGNTYPLKVGGLFPLFWVQYSYLGLNPHFSDDYVDYWQQGVNASLINHDYCVQNPKKFIGYSDECWGLTASDNQSGYNAHSPANDLGVITPTAALSSFPYTPDESMKALKFFYYKMGDRLWGDYGFYDAFNATENWYASSYLAIDQGPIIVMIENYRTGLLWNLFMSAPEVQNAMTELNFQD